MMQCERILCFCISWEIIFIIASSAALTYKEKLPLVDRNDLSHRISKRAPTNISEGSVVKRQLHNLRGQPGNGYYLEMGIGTPPQKFNILVDTGSSNFAVAAYAFDPTTKYFNSSNSQTYDYDGTEVDVPYTQGSWKGQLAHDKVMIPSLPSVNVTADIAFITESERFFQNGSHWQGILGLAYSQIVRPDDSVEVFMDSLKEQSSLPDLFSMQLCGIVDLPNVTNVNTGGTLIFGGVEKSLYMGSIQYAPIYKEWYYEIIITSIAVGGRSLQLDCKEYNFDKTIVDSGTTNLRLPKKVYERFVELVQEMTNVGYRGRSVPMDFWFGSDLLCWPPSEVPWGDFPTVTIEIAASSENVFTLEISPQQYLRQESNLAKGDDCFKFAVSSSTTGTVLGAVIMEGFYVIFDRQNKQVGFAKTTCSSAKRNTQYSFVSGIKSVKYNTSACAYMKPDSDLTPLAIASYVMVGLCILFLLPILLFFLQCQYYRRCKKKPEGNEELMIDDTLLTSEADTRKNYRSFTPR